jgi:hypothetical protein
MINDHWNGLRMFRKKQKDIIWFYPKILSLSGIPTGQSEEQLVVALTLAIGHRPQGSQRTWQVSAKVPKLGSEFLGSPLDVLMNIVK